jgi:2-polyprenyl-3-methyl-5-hydroxy-6-metoxy-1,4-benzoquinol methylase
MENLSDKKYWDNEWQNEKRDYTKFIFRDLLEKYLPKGGTYFEAGCAPGSIMCYFNKVLGYKVTGVDYSSSDVIENYLTMHGVENYEIFHHDFTTFKTEERFDVVASYGLIEHFDKYLDVIELHSKLVDKNGYLVLEMPNLRFFNWLIYRIYNPKLLKMHNLKVMDLSVLREAVKDDFNILYLNYYKSSFVFFNDENAELDNFKIIKKLLNILKKTLSKIGLENLPNRFFSPYIVLIAQKKIK